MKIIDSYTEIAACFPNNTFSLDAWRAYAASISPELPEKCLQDAAEYDFPTQVAPVLAALAAEPAKAHQAHAAFLRHMERIPSLDVDATVVLYLGLCNAAGWATELDGRPAVLLGLEKIVELNWCDDASMTALIDHELGHLWHFQHRSAPEFANAALWQLYTEGMAMLFEQRLAGDKRYFHQNKNGWLPWCEANRDSLFAEYRRRVMAGESVQDFFGDWCSYQGHSDVGYYLGSVLMWQLAQRFAPAELANLTERDILNAMP
ncbi:MAG: hypothetical protein E7316_01960 [Clostridiales bacterium]|nr:hypothetical protein [Clostridiales bacterium]